MQMSSLKSAITSVATPRRMLLAASLGLAAFHSTPASAIIGLTAYVSRTGSGTACTSGSPCASMATAIGVAGTKGVVICLDKGNYAGVNITFAITISCGDALWEATGTLISINTPAGTDVVIEGLVSDAQGSPADIISFTGQGALHLHRVRIGNTLQNGLVFQPSGPAKLFVTDSHFYNAASGGITAGIMIRPASGVTANVVIERTRIENNQFGIIADGNNGGTIRGVVRDSVIAGNINNGITVATTNTNAVLSVERSTISGNNFGLVATGSVAGMLVGGSNITGNSTGLFTASGGILLSYRDNRLNANTSDGVFTGPVGLQ